MEPGSQKQLQTSSSASFYVTGGTLRGDASSYVLRQADEALFAGLLAGEFCYVLDARQMGKSSLMVRTAARLEAEGISVIKLDLTAVGLDLTSEQWYFGLLEGLGCRPETEMEAFWEANRQLGPLQRWFKAIEEVLLTSTRGGVVIFVDEIDIVRSLPFRTDEFFAGIRALYNRRSSVGELQRLTFCLLGVTTPSELIEDVAMTPFNIGTRVELNDFAPHEAALLGRGLSGTGRNGAVLLERVLYWTGGHPYLTQQLCRSVAEAEEIRSADDVDRICADLFLSPRARKQDNNLLFVRARLLQSGTDVAGLLELYGQVHANRRVSDDETIPLIDHLRLSGIVRVISGCLRVRNRIYFLVFDQDWVRTNMPDAEVRRQRNAFRRGVRRTVALAGAVLSIMLGLVLFAFQQADRVGKLAKEDRRLTGIAERNLYFANMNVIQRDWEDNNVAHVRELLDQTRSFTSRGFEWGYWNRLCHMDIATFAHAAYPARFSPDGRYMFTNDGGDNPGTGIIWDSKTCRIARYLAGYHVSIRSAAFSPDSRYLITAGSRNTATIWSVASGRALFKLVGHKQPVTSVAFSFDGRRILTGSVDAMAKVWDAKSGREILSLRQQREIRAVAFSPDDRRVVTGGGDRDLAGSGEAYVWDIQTGSRMFALVGHHGIVTSVAFSPDGTRIVTGSTDSTARVWDARTGRAMLTLKGHTLEVMAVAFSPDGRRVLSGSDDNLAIEWDAVTGRAALLLRGNVERVWSVAFSPDGKRILTGGIDKASILWDTAEIRETVTLSGHKGPVYAAAFSSDGRRVATGGDDAQARVWDARSGKELRALVGHARPIRSISFSPDDQRILTASDDHTAMVWDANTGSKLLTVRGHTKPIVAIAFSPDGTHILTGSLDGTAKVWDSTNGKLSLTLRGEINAVRAVAFSSDGQRLLTGGGGQNAGFPGAAEVWDARSGRKILTLSGHYSSVSSVAFSPDGRRIVTGELHARTAQVWDARTGLPTLTLKGHKGVVMSAVFSPDGRRILSGSGDNTAKVWDSESGQEILTLKGHSDTVTSACFSADGMRIITGSFDKTARIWVSDAEAGNR